MDTSILFANMNPFGNMLLVTMQNCFIVTEKGKVEGKWFELNPNLWKSQITSYRDENFDTFVDMACIETPMEGEPIVSRMVFKTYCHGENLSSAYEVVSDVAQTINNIRTNIEERKLFFEDNKLCSSAEASDKVMLSLEVTGYRLNRAQNNMNSNTTEELRQVEELELEASVRDSVLQSHNPPSQTCPKRRRRYR
ncbi:hypothetical protein O3P69_020965 [Scylla paramamosain]|uniref:Uncharacterized protein n=1 Tax=Scylla paramamosain TaxID=85552 RepID=A0AAW0SGD4_SCYPA